MELKLLFRRDLKRMRGTIISMAVLTMLIVMLGRITFSMKGDFHAGMTEAFEACNGADIYAFTRDYEKSEQPELYSKLEQDPETEKVQKVRSVDSDLYFIDGEYKFSSWVYYCSQTEMNGQYRLFNEDLNGFEETIPALHSNEIYVPIDTKVKLRCEVGDTVTNVYREPYIDENGTFQFKDKNSDEYIIKGFIQTVTNDTGNYAIICDDDFESLYGVAVLGSAAMEKTDVSTFAYSGRLLEIYAADNSALSSKEYLRHLNNTVSLNSYVSSSITRDEIEEARGDYVNIFYKVFIAFSIVLLIIVIVVMTNNISSDIENDYSELGVMKTIGFSNRLLRIESGMIYIFAELAGALIGFVASIFISRALAEAMVLNTGVISSGSIKWGKSLILILLIMVVSVLVIVIKTGALNKVSPIKAISGNRDDVTFDNRGTVPIGKRAFTLKIAVRAITSEPKRFIGISVITAFLCFAMLMAASSVYLFKDNTVVRAMGFDSHELYISGKAGCEISDEMEEDVFDIINEYTEIECFYDVNESSVFLNGDSINCFIYKHPEQLGNIVKGRAPIYGNEFTCTQKICDEYGLSIGDEVLIGYNDVAEKYILSGIDQRMYYLGMSITMSMEGFQKLCPEMHCSYLGVDIKDASQAETIEKRLEDCYGEKYICGSEDSSEEVTGYFSTATLIARIVIFVFSIVFFFVTIKMLVTKTFIRERKDLGIYKAIGFTSKRLRLIFALRFTTVSVVGAAVGTILGVLFSGKVLGLLLSYIGASYLPIKFGLSEILIVLITVFATTFIAGYLTSGKIKRVDVKELIVE